MIIKTNKKVWFTDHSSKPLEIEDKNEYYLCYWLKYKNDLHFSLTKYWIIVKGYRFLSFAKNRGKNIGKYISKQ